MSYVRKKGIWRMANIWNRCGLIGRWEEGVRSNKQQLGEKEKRAAQRLRNRCAFTNYINYIRTVLAELLPKVKRRTQQ